MLIDLLKLCGMAVLLTACFLSYTYADNIHDEVKAFMSLVLYNEHLSLDEERQLFGSGGDESIEIISGLCDRANLGDDSQIDECNAYVDGLNTKNQSLMLLWLRNYFLQLGIQHSDIEVISVHRNDSLAVADYQLITVNASGALLVFYDNLALDYEGNPFGKLSLSSINGEGLYYLIKSRRYFESFIDELQRAANNMN
jgi:hypothetical protein